MITRRKFCLGIGSALVTPAIRSVCRLPAARTAWGAPQDVDPCGGYTVAPPKEFLFTDVRHIEVGDLQWLSPEGKPIPVAGPPDPPVRAHAVLGSVPRGIRLVAQPARKEGPIEELPTRVLYHDGLYRSWAVQANYPSGGNLGSYSTAEAKSITIRYGQSKDGYAWEWRDAGEIEISGQTGIDGDGFFIDPHGPEEERYKCVYNARVVANNAELWQRYEQVHPRHRDVRLGPSYIYCLFGLVSADGLNWRRIDEPLMIHKGDTDNTVYFDPWLGKYVLYTRLYWMRRRMIARAESDDFRHWTPVDPIVQPGLEDPLSCDVYTNGRTCYPGLPEHHLMFPMYYRRYTQTSEIHLLTSIDGIRWQRVPGGPVLEPGDPGEWDGEFVVAGKGLVPLGKDRVAIPYAGTTHPHKYPRWPGVISHGSGWASWTKGRLCAIAAREEGEFHTFGVTVTGEGLKVNAKVRRAGRLRVGLSGVEGRSVAECDGIVGDDPAHPVTWKGDSHLGVSPGSSVALHFDLRAAELYGFEWV